MSCGQKSSRDSDETLAIDVIALINHTPVAVKSHIAAMTAAVLIHRHLSNGPTIVSDDVLAVQLAVDVLTDDVWLAAVKSTRI